MGDKTISDERKPLKIVVRTSSYTIRAIDEVIIADTSSGSFNLTLPPAYQTKGKEIRVKRIGANNVTVLSTYGTIDGAASLVISANEEGFLFVSDGVKYITLDAGSGSGGGGGGGSVASFAAENKTLASIVQGMCVSTHASGTGVILATATAAIKRCIGLCGDPAIAPAATGSIVVSGVMTLPDWTAITGTILLATQAIYYLDVVGGKMLTPDPMAGVISQKIGIAVSPATLSISIDEPYLL